MPGVKGLRRLQVGKETTDAHGTAVAATAALRMEGLWKDDTELVFPDEYTGYLGGRDRAYIPYVAASMDMSGTATFEELPYILEAGVAFAAPTTDVGTSVARTYAFATTAQNEPRTFTIEAGDDQQAEEAAYCLVTDFTLSGKAKEAWTVSANWIGRQVYSTDAFTASSDCAVAAVESMLFQKTKLYIDPTTDTIGTTQKSNTLLEADLNVVTGFMPVYTASGNLYFDTHKQSAPEVTLDITFEHDASATAEKAFWRAGTPRQIRLLCEGSALTTTDTYSNKLMQINLAGKWETFDVLGDQDGNDICKGSFRARYNSDAALFGSILIVNEVAALP